MLSARPLAPLAFLLSFAAGCGAAPAEEVEADQGAIRGGQEDATLAKSVVQIYAEQVHGDGSTGKNNYCAGVVLKADLVLTAPGCFAFEKWVWQADRPFTTRSVVMTGPRVRISQILRAPTNVEGITIIVPDGLETASDREILDGSVALVKLTAPLEGAVPMTLGEDALEGDAVKAWGYGCDGESRSSYGVLRSLPLKWGEWDASLFDWFPTKFTCQPGDGGAVLVDARGKVVGMSPKSDAVLPLVGTLKQAIEAKLR